MITKRARALQLLDGNRYNKEAKEMLAEEVKKERRAQQVVWAFVETINSLKKNHAEFKLPDVAEAKRLLSTLDPNAIFAKAESPRSPKGTFEASLTNPSQAETILIWTHKQVVKEMGTNENHPLMLLQMTLQRILSQCIRARVTPTCVEEVPRSQWRPFASSAF